MLPGIKWAAPLPASLQNCLPDGGCFARQGMARFGDHSLDVIAGGARTFVTNIYFRSTARAMGETNVLDALKQAGFTPELARCPVPGTIGGTKLVSAAEREQQSRCALRSILVQRLALRGLPAHSRRRFAATAAAAVGHVFGTRFRRAGS